MHSSKFSFSRILMLVFLACTIVACQEDVVHRYCAVDCLDWQPKYKARFHLTDFAKGKGRYALSVEARLSERYPCKDLWLVVETKRNGEALPNDTVRMSVVNSKGEMKGAGKSILGYTQTLHTMQLHSSDTLDVCIRHIMTVHPLPGVHDVGFLLEPVE